MDGEKKTLKGELAPSTFWEVCHNQIGEDAWIPAEQALLYEEDS